MASIADAPLAELCEEADPAAVTAFVADLYEARGWTADRRGERQLVVSDGDRETRLAVAHPDDPLAPETVEWADTAVVVGGTDAAPGDVDVIDAAGLSRQLAYALDRQVARELLRSHFGWSPSVPAEDRVESGDSDPDADHPSWPLVGGPRVLLAAVLVLAVAGGVTVAVADGIGGSDPAVDDAEQAMDSATPTETPTDDASAPSAEQTATATERTPTPTAGTGQDDEQFENLPPGIDQSGTIDPRALSSAQEPLLVNQSYRLSLTYREFASGRPTGVYAETIRVANATRYSASVTRQGTVRAIPFPIAGIDAYADGSVRYERTDESTVERGVLLSYDRFLDDYALYLVWFLNVRESTIVERRSVNGTATFYLVTEENSDPSIRNTTGSLVVREDGLVTNAHWSYDLSGTPGGYGNLSATVDLRISDVGSTTVREPDWVNASASD